MIAGVFRVRTDLLFLALIGKAAACETLGQQLAHDEPVVKARLLALKPGQRLSGIRLCDGSKIVVGWQYLRPARTQRAHQHVLLFRAGRSVRAVIWVDDRGKAIPVPACPYGDRFGCMAEGGPLPSERAAKWSPSRENASA